MEEKRVVNSQCGASCARGLDVDGVNTCRSVALRPRGRVSGAKSCFALGERLARPPTTFWSTSATNAAIAAFGSGTAAVSGSTFFSTSPTR